MHGIVLKAVLIVWLVGRIQKNGFSTFFDELTFYRYKQLFARKKTILNRKLWICYRLYIENPVYHPDYIIPIYSMIEIYLFYKSKLNYNIMTDSEFICVLLFYLLFNKI